MARKFIQQYTSAQAAHDGKNTDQGCDACGSERIGNLDGLQALQPGVYLVTDWDAGGLYRVPPKGKIERLIKL